ncbi:MAG: helix-turn-helix transcriptional regulator, partial [Ktedonobacteraceae bacterium]
MYKQVMLLGLLLEKPMYGQQIREVIERHHNLFADFIKKPTIYYQLERLTQDSYLEVRRENVEAPG